MTNLREIGWKNHQVSCTVQMCMTYVAMKERSQERGNNRLQITETVFEKVLGPHKLKQNKILTISQNKCPSGLKDMDILFSIGYIFCLLFCLF